jgi:hypothetical protein
MSDVAEKISVIQRFLNTLSWKKLIQLVLFFVIIGVAWGAFENRSAIYGALHSSRFAESPTHEYKLSKYSTNAIDSVVNKSELIVGLQITIVDFNKNTRLIVYSSIDDEALQKVYKAYIEKSVGEVPLFNADANNNIRMSQLINGEFVCNPFEETLAYKLVPDASKTVKSICANGIPPYYGKFTGIITIYLKRNPTETERDQLKVLSKELSVSIFERDFK